MTDLRAKLRPYVVAIVEQLVDEAVERIETTARDRLKAALEPAPIARRDVKPANKSKRKPPRKVKRSKPARARTRHPSKVDEIARLRRVAAAPPQLVHSTPNPQRPCGCHIRGPHRKACAFGELKRDAAPIEPDEAPEYSPPSPAARADRFAKIEASAQKRTGMLPATSATFTTDGRL